eukprot:489748_1
MFFNSITLYISKIIFFFIWFIMSTEKIAELLTFGFITESYSDAFPEPLINLIQKFYDEYIYWHFTDKQLNQFKNANKGHKMICDKSFDIKGIQFKIICYPNGKTSNGATLIKFKMESWPADIEYIDLYKHVKCEQTKSIVKALSKASKRHATISSNVCPFSELKPMKTICFSLLIEIRCIKYKYEQHCKKNYYSAINKMSTYYKYIWNINGSLMEKCKRMRKKERIFSENFDNNNWCLILWPNGFDHDGKPIICFNCLSIPHSIQSMDLFIIVCIDYDKENEKSFSTNFKYGQSRRSMVLSDIISFEQFKIKNSVPFTVELQIINVYDKHHKLIDKNKWVELGIVDTKTT